MRLDLPRAPACAATFGPGPSKTTLAQRWDVSPGAHGLPRGQQGSRPLSSGASGRSGIGLFGSVPPRVPAEEGNHGPS